MLDSGMLKMCRTSGTLPRLISTPAKRLIPMYSRLPPVFRLSSQLEVSIQRRLERTWTRYRRYWW